MGVIVGTDANAAIQFDVAGVPTTLGLRRSWSLNFDQDTIDTSNASDNGWANFEAGRRTGTVDFEAIYDKGDSVQKEMRTAFLNQSNLDFTGNLDGEAWTGSTTISSYNTDVNHDDIVTLTVSLNLRGAASFA